MRGARRLLPSLLRACLLSACVLASLLLVLGACTEPRAAERPAQGDGQAVPAPAGGLPAAVLRALDPPAGPGAMAPGLSAGTSGIHLVWLEPQAAGGGQRMRISQLVGDRWQAPVDVVASDRLFANWADTPAVIEAADGTMYAHWLEKLGPGTYAYGAQLARSEDGGAHWQRMGLLHDDRSETEHGFVSFAASAEGGVEVAWLDGRATASGGLMQMRAARLEGAEVVRRRLVASSSCDCCATAMAMAAGGPVVAFRDRTAEEIRDIAVVRRTGAGWQPPVIVHQDGWKIAGCPVNGPAIAADGARVMVAWFTAAGDQARVQVSFSDDGGGSFAPPILLDGARPIGRVGAALIGDHGYVTWLARSSAATRAQLRLARIGADGTLEAVDTIALTSPARAAGVARLVADHGRLLVAWVEASEPSALHVTAIALAA